MLLLRQSNFFVENIGILIEDQKLACVQIFHWKFKLSLLNIEVPTKFKTSSAKYWTFKIWKIKIWSAKYWLGETARNSLSINNRLISVTSVKKFPSLSAPGASCYA